MIYTHVAAFLAGLAVAAVSTWYVQAWRYDAQIAGISQKHATAALKLSEAARADETQTALKESTHAADTSKNSDAFTTSQPVRDAIARADLAIADRLRTDAERRAATYRAQAAACTTASSGIADRLEAFDRHVVEGAAVVAEHRQALIRRDAEVALLRWQIDTDRALMARSSARAWLTAPRRSFDCSKRTSATAASMRASWKTQAASAATAATIRWVRRVRFIAFARQTRRSAPAAHYRAGCRPSRR